jgi:prephenate dehydratase
MSDQKLTTGELVAIQGDLGSNHHLLLTQMLPGAGVLSCKSFKELFEAVVDQTTSDQKTQKPSAALGLLAIENSLAGSLLGNFDLLSSYPVKVIGEGYLRIEHCLIGLPGSNLAQIKRVYSHEMALKQCDQYLSDHNLEPVEYFDTAAAVKHIAEIGDPSCAAIAPAIAAGIYGGQLLERGIETNKQNYTRFLLIAPLEGSRRQASSVKISDGPTKVMLELELKHEVGSLAKVLKLIVDLGYNLTKIESRPIIGTAWKYKFYLDFEVDQSLIADLTKGLTHLEGASSSLKVLGHFPSGRTYEAVTNDTFTTDNITK